MKNQTKIAKITPPAVLGVVPRSRLFDRMDRALKGSVVWVSAPAGSGKTTLAKSYLDARKVPCLWYQVDGGDGDPATFFYYMGLAARRTLSPGRKPLPLLTPEFLPGLATFTRRYFEGLFGRMAVPFTLVLDNYQEVPEDSVFQDVIREGLGVLPEGIRVLVLSRSDPPPGLARLRAGGGMELLGWEEIRFSLEESRDLFRRRGLKEPPEAVLRELQARTEGWAAGLILLTEGFKRTGGVSALPPQLAQREIFNYFAGEIFDKTDDETRDLLLKTSFLPAVPVPIALKLTGNVRAGDILDGLHRKHYFTHRHSPDEPLYQYHPLFREFLTARARVLYAPDTVAGIQRRAAGLLEEIGRFEDAAALYLAARDWEGLVRLVRTHAETLVGQGRQGTLAEWLKEVPGEILEWNPWLLYWRGTSRMHRDLRGGREDLERAFPLFGRQGDAAGLYLCWSGIIDTFVYEWSDFTPVDRWIAEFDHLRKAHPVFPSPYIKARVSAGIFAALMYRQPHHPDLPRWEERVRKILFDSEDIPLKTAVSGHLILYYTWWTGEQAKAELLINTLRPAAQGPEISPLFMVVWKSIEAAYRWMTADHEGCLEAVQKGFETAKASGMHLWDFMLGAQASFATLTAGNLEAAGLYLRNMAFILHTPRRLDIAHYHYHLGWEALCHGNLSLAREHMDLGVEFSREAGVPFMSAFIIMGLAEVCIESGEYREAERLLKEARGLGRGMKSMTVEYQYAWLEAYRRLRKGDEKGMIEPLKKHLGLSREYGILNHACWRAPVMVKLYAKALEAGIEAEHARFMILKRGMVPDPSLGETPEWPWGVRVFTLGGFEVERDGKPLRYPGRVPQKPLALLKLLITAGERGLSEHQVGEVLWPEADGDAAHSAFTTTLQRLRKLVGEWTVRLQAGCASLNPRHAWVDAWAFERLLEKAALSKDGGSDGLAVDRAARAMDLYRGDFLGKEDASPWAMPHREHLRMRFHKCLRKLGEAHEQAGQWKDALDWYERGLEVDDLSEEIYQRYMLCCGKLGLRAEGAAAYRRCAAALSAKLGIEPSSETEAIYRSLLARS